MASEYQVFFAIAENIRARVVAVDNPEPTVHTTAFNRRDETYEVTVPVGKAGLEYEDLLKFSRNRDVDIEGFSIYGGREDCIDIVRGSDYRITNCDLYPQGLYGITAKGSVSGLYVTNVTFHGHGKAADIDLGNWEDYSYSPRPKCRKIVLNNVQSSDDKPVKVRVLHSEVPEIVNSNVDLVVYPRVVVWGFFCVKRILVYLGFGTKIRGSYMDPLYEEAG